MGESTPSSSSASGDADALIAKLTEEFRTRLDDTLIFVIASERDLTQDYDEVHGILTSLAQDVPNEEAPISDTASVPSSENPTASKQPSPGVDELSSLEWADSTEPSQTTLDSARQLSDSSNDDWELYLTERFADLEVPEDVNVSKLDEDGKVAELKLMFAGLKELDLKLTLRKCKGDFAKAADELLFLQCLEDNGWRHKGIEGAFRGDGVYFRNRSGTPKDKHQNKGKSRLEVDYKLRPLNLSENDAYAKPTTPRTVTTRRSLPRITTSTPVTGNMTVSAPISPALKPVTGWETVPPKKKTHQQLCSEAAASKAFADLTADRATSAYRRGKSDALYRPVAGIRAEQAREQRARTRLLDAEKHEAHVDRTARANAIDLHGVPVADGVRIALERTNAWWVGLGEDRAKKARQQGFVVVTGLGNHNTSGVSRLRQEVGAALKREWYTSVETGQFVVTGKR